MAIFFKFTILNYLCYLAYTHGRPALTQTYAQNIVQDAGTHTIFFCLLMWFATPNAFNLLPVLLMEGLYVSMIVTTLLSLTHQTSVIATYMQWCDPLVGKLVNKSNWHKTTSSDKWTVLLQWAPEMAALLQVFQGLTFLMLLLTPSRKVLLTIMYWQLMKLLYVVSAPLQAAFATLDQSILTLVVARAPPMVGLCYGTFKKVLVTLGQSTRPSQGTPASSPLSSCTIS